MSEAEKEYLSTKRQYQISTLGAVGIVFIGTLFYHAFEHWSFLNSTYFSVVTLATVGYGDYVPTTPEGKIFTMIYIIVGIGILTTFIQAVVRNRQARRAYKQAKKSL